MKKGDIISYTTPIEKGSALAFGFESEEKALEWIRTQSTPAEPVKNENGKWDVVCTCEWESKDRAKVNWVVDGEMGYTLLDSGDTNGGSIEGWVVEVESAPSFQSSVESMSEESLRASLEELRMSRTKSKSIPKLKSKSKSKSQSGVRVKNDPIMQMISKLPPEKREGLMKKLGLV